MPGAKYEKRNGVWKLLLQDRDIQFAESGSKQSAKTVLQGDGLESVSEASRKAKQLLKESDPMSARAFASTASSIVCHGIVTGARMHSVLGLRTVIVLTYYYACVYLSIYLGFSSYLLRA